MIRDRSAHSRLHRQGPWLLSGLAAGGQPQRRIPAPRVLCTARPPAWLCEAGATRQVRPGDPGAPLVDHNPQKISECRRTASLCQREAGGPCRRGHGGRCAPWLWPVLAKPGLMPCGLSMPCHREHHPSRITVSPTVHMLQVTSPNPVTEGFTHTHIRSSLIKLTRGDLGGACPRVRASLAHSCGSSSSHVVGTLKPHTQRWAGQCPHGPAHAHPRGGVA